MIKISPKPKNRIGKIYQITQNIKAFNPSEFTVIQTFSKKIPNSIHIFTKFSLLNFQIYRNTVIFTISSFNIDEEIHTFLRKATLKGFDIYLFTIEKYKLWCVDEMIYDITA